MHKKFHRYTNKMGLQFYSSLICAFNPEYAYERYRQFLTRQLVRGLI